MQTRCQDGTAPLLLIKTAVIGHVYGEAAVAAWNRLRFHHRRHKRHGRSGLSRQELPSWPRRRHFRPGLFFDYPTKSRH